MEIAVEAGASDVRDEGEVMIVFTPFAEYAAVKDAIEAAGIPVDSGEVANVPQNTVELDEEAGRRVMALIEALEDNDDVQNVSHNADIPDAAMAEA